MAIGVNLLLSIYYYPLSRMEQLTQYELISSRQSPVWLESIYYGLPLGVFPYYLYHTYLLLQKYEHYILTKFSCQEDSNWLVSEAKHEHFTLLGLAFEAGFNSKATFHAICKKFTQQTPSEYVRNLQTLPSAGSRLL